MEEKSRVCLTEADRRKSSDYVPCDFESDGAQEDRNKNCRQAFFISSIIVIIFL